ncbi:MAG: hypothetical protein IT449_15100 [Phycisphaerales bacterium]|nr:hypothetical protein [Phycisphaerales bacterium]
MPQPSACCLFDGGCALRYEDECLADGGVWHENLQCEEVECLEQHACCLDSGTCLDLSEQGCAAHSDGVWHESQTCATFDCPQPRACCFDTGACRDALESECAALGGVWNPEGRCSQVDCPRPGACCFEDGSCEEVLKSICRERGGSFQEEGAACNLQCLCPFVPRMRASCSPGGFIRSRVRFSSEIAEGQVILLSIDDFDFPVGVHDRKAILIAGPFTGAHVVALRDPDCGDPVAVDCGP